MPDVGAGVIPIQPDASGFSRELQRQVGPMVDKFARDVNDQIRGDKSFKETGKKVGSEVGEGLQSGFKGFHSQFVSSLDGMNKKMLGFGRNSFQVGKQISIGFTLPVLAAFKHAFDAASDLNEAVNVTGLVFEEQSAAIDSFAKNAAKNFGLSERAARDATSNIGGLLKNMGFSLDEVAARSQSIVALGSDLGSAFNKEPAEAVEAIASALRGESEPIRAFNVMLNEAAIKAEAMRLGLVKYSQDSTKIEAAHVRLEKAQRKYNQALAEHGESSFEAREASAAMGTAQANLEKLMEGSAEDIDANVKAQATLSLIFQQTADVQGDFANTVDGAANKQRILKAELENTSAVIGNQLLPIGVKLLGWVQKLLDGFTKLTPKGQKVALIIAGILAAIGPAVTVLGGLVTAIGAVSTALTFLIANPIVLVLAAITAALVYAYFRFEKFREIVDKVARFIKDHLVQVIGVALFGVVGLLVALIYEAYQRFEGFRNVVDAVARVVRDVAVAAFRGLVTLWTEYLIPAAEAVADFMVNDLWPAIQTAWDGILTVVRFAWNNVIKPVFEAIVWYVQTILMPIFRAWLWLMTNLVFPLIIAAATEMWEILKQIFGFLHWTLDTIVMPVLRALGWVVEHVFGAIAAFVTYAWRVGIQPILSEFVGFIQDKLVPVWEAVRGAAAVAWNALPGIIGGALRVIGGLLSTFLGGVAGVADAIGLDHIAGVLRNAADSAKGWGHGPAGPANVGGIRVEGGIRRNRGGFIPGPDVDRDIVPAMLTPGEYVIRKRSVEKFGAGLFEALNDGRLPFAFGGLVPNPWDIVEGLADGVVDRARDLGTAALERVFPALNQNSGNMFSTSPPGGDFPAGIANRVRSTLFEFIRGEEQKMSNLSGGGFSRAGGGGPAGRYTAGMNLARMLVLGGVGPMPVGGYANRNIAGTSSKSAHAMWRAFDFMVGLGNVAKGNRVANLLIANAHRIGLKGLIWNDQKNFGGGWGPYLHPGGRRDPTSQHRDHVHAEFFRSGGLVHGRSFDTGGVLAPGWNAVRNDTGAPEQLVPAAGRSIFGDVHVHDEADVDMLLRRAQFAMTAGNL